MCRRLVPYITAGNTITAMIAKHFATAIVSEPSSGAVAISGCAISPVGSSCSAWSQG